MATSKGWLNLTLFHALLWRLANNQLIKPGVQFLLLNFRLFQLDSVFSICWHQLCWSNVIITVHASIQTINIHIHNCLQSVMGDLEILGKHICKLWKQLVFKNVGSFQFIFFFYYWLFCILFHIEPSHRLSTFSFHVNLHFQSSYIRCSHKHQNLPKNTSQCCPVGGAARLSASSHAKTSQLWVFGKCKWFIKFVAALCFVGVLWVLPYFFFNIVSYFFTNTQPNWHVLSEDQRMKAIILMTDTNKNRDSQPRAEERYHWLRNGPFKSSVLSVW